MKKTILFFIFACFACFSYVNAQEEVRKVKGPIVSVKSIKDGKIDLQVSEVNTFFPGIYQFLVFVDKNKNGELESGEGCFVITTDKKAAKFVMGKGKEGEDIALVDAALLDRPTIDGILRKYKDGEIEPKIEKCKHAIDTLKNKLENEVESKEDSIEISRNLADTKVKLADLSDNEKNGIEVLREKLGNVSSYYYYAFSFDVMSYSDYKKRIKRKKKMAGD